MSGGTAETSCVAPVVADMALPKDGFVAACDPPYWVIVDEVLPHDGTVFPRCASLCHAAHATCDIQEEACGKSVVVCSGPCSGRRPAGYRALPIKGSMDAVGRFWADVSQLEAASKLPLT